MTKLDGSKTYTIKLRSCPNPDFGETRAPKDPVTASGILADVLAVAAKYREGIGGGNWKRAGLYLEGKLVGEVAYNGRVFQPGSWRNGMDPIA